MDGQVYLQFLGPSVVTSAVGAAAPPGGLGGLSALGTEMAWRELLQRQGDRPHKVAAIAGAVGAAAPPGGWVGLSILGAMAARGDQAELLGKPRRLPSLFEAQDANRR
jgi:hypothetical protein